MLDDFVSLETAKLLKQKGFNELCMYYYEPSGSFTSVDTRYSPCGHTNITIEYNNNAFKERCMAPSLYVAMKWLREKGHNIILTMLPKDNDRYVLWTFNIYSNKNYKIIWGELYEQPKYNTYEEACEAAIKYCLTNNKI